MCHGCLYGNKLTLEKMRQNPINTAAGKSRKTPSDSQWPTHPRTHTHKLWYSVYKPLASCQSKKQKKSIGLSNWSDTMKPSKPFKRCCQDKRMNHRTQHSTVWTICSEFELYSGLLLYHRGASGWPRLYLTHSGTEQLTLHLVCLSSLGKATSSTHW